MKTITGPLAILFFAVFCLYWLASGDYFLFDDGPAITGNTAIAELDPASAAGWLDAVRSSNSGPTGRPVAMFSLALNAAFTQALSAIPFKLGNLLVHLACGGLLFGFLLELRRASFDNRSGGHLPLAVAGLACALWLVAPLHVSTVLYPVQRMAQLATLFVLLGLYLFARWRNHWAERGASVAELVAASLWLALVVFMATLSKENGLLLLWLLPLVEVAFFRGRWRAVQRPWLQRLGWLVLLSPLVLVAVIFMVIPDAVTGGYGSRDFTLYERLLTQLRVLWHYVGWLLLPVPSHLGFLHDDIVVSSGWLAPWTTVVAAMGWLAVLGIALASYRARPWLFFGILFFLIGHSLESGFLALEMVFEHRNYLPSIGLYIVAGGLLLELSRRLPAINPRLLLVACFLPLLLLLALRTHTWSEEFRMANVNARHHPQSPRGLYFQSRALEKRHQQGVAEGATDNPDDLLRARRALQQMASLEPGSIVPFAALYLLDYQYFPANPEQAQWLGAILARAGKPVLSASESNGLNAVIRRLLADCEGDMRVASSLINSLQASGRDSATWDMAAYELARCNAGQDRRQRNEDSAFAALERKYPDNIQVLYRRLARAVEAGDVAGMYAAVGRILAVDEDRRQTSRLLTLVAD
ncbi:hypothetical protein CWI75_05825 [Kineobactrum sediminis]|uniref:Tetratricopeptide repeat protein n=1 Tax=Kineobactrum sediminis TaxID=1905677 RepID=A0A2N5Y3H9_9GAMM|nr:hypothetical protein [Kineobactrum sediminis]PLW82952.1 hypothetical protein CWI75_05825 [Kineobactrum sediminis]